MKNSEIEDPLFLKAVEAVDSGNISVLENLIVNNPRLVSDSLNYPIEGYFKNPYLLWFVADNPIRIDKLSANIADITRMLIRYVKAEADNAEHQIDYALGLVATGRIPKECGVQIELMDLLIAEGAKPEGSIGALAHGNMEAAKHLVEKGEQLSLAAAVGFNSMKDVIGLAPAASAEERLLALTVAAFYGNADIISYLLSIGTNPNGYPKNTSGFHSHATPLHQAVFSGSLDAVKLLVEAGAALNAKDKIYEGTVLGWAEHVSNEETHDKPSREKYLIIADYLRGKEQGK